MSKNEPTLHRYELQVPEAVKTVCRAFYAAKEKVFIVGGCLRDAYYGLKPKDWDLATACEPERVKEILDTFRDEKHPLGIHHFPKGEAFGVISAMPWCGNHEGNKGRYAFEVEIATFRKDIGEGRRPDSVKFCDMEEDAKRRDFTINALYYDPLNNRIYDYVGGFNDLSNRTVRCVGNPMDRFREDPLRVLRYIRFLCKITQSTYSEYADSDHRKAVGVYAKMGLKGVSPERVREEFLKGVNSSNYHYVLSLKSAELLNNVVFPGCKVSDCERLHTSNKYTLIASLLVETGSKKIEALLNKLCYSSEECKYVYFYMFFNEIFQSDGGDIKEKMDEVYQIKKFEKTRHLNVDKYLRSWGDTFGINRTPIDAYRMWTLSSSVNEVPDIAGLKGKEIGQRMKEYDFEQFKGLLNSIALSRS